jgi:tetratricopeptide (TPR) repeat protein
MISKSDPIQNLYEQMRGISEAEVSEDALTVQDIFDRRPPADNQLGEEVLEETVARVERLYEEGEISALTAAEMLDLSLREFVELFVLDENWFATIGIIKQAEREKMLDEMTSVLSREVIGLSVKEFVEEYVLDDDFLSLMSSRTRNQKQDLLPLALEELPTELLGNLLRRALSTGSSAAEFIRDKVLTEGWFFKLGIYESAIRQRILAKATEALTGLCEYRFNHLWFTAFAVKNREISDDFVDRLGEAIATRELKLVTKLLAKWDYRTVLLSPGEKNAARLLSYYAQWVDFDSSYLPKVEHLLGEFRRVPRSKLTALEFAHLGTAEGLVRFHDEQYDDAVKRFSEVMRCADHMDERDLMALSRYYLARCFWKKGNYHVAKGCAQQAREIDEGSHRRKRVAAIQMVEGWLSFLSGSMPEARQLLGEAEQELKHTEPINHGNVLSFYGRLYLKEELYDKALKYFWKAILVYREGSPKHRNVARTHANIASVYYLRAGQVPASPASRQKLLQLRLKAFEHLDAAEYLYNEDSRRNHRGLGRVHHLRALLYTSANEIDRARDEAEKAYDLGLVKEDHIIMGRAKRVLWKATPNVFEGLALSFEALLHAEQTENRTLRARAYVNLGSNLLKISEVDQGKKYLHDGHRCLTPDERARPYWREVFRKAHEGSTSTSLDCELCENTDSWQESGHELLVEQKLAGAEAFVLSLPKSSSGTSVTKWLRQDLLTNAGISTQQDSDEVSRDNEG